MPLHKKEGSVELIVENWDGELAVRLPQLWIDKYGLNETSVVQANIIGPGVLHLMFDLPAAPRPAVLEQG